MHLFLAAHGEAVRGDRQIEAGGVGGDDGAEHIRAQAMFFEQGGVRADQGHEMRTRRMTGEDDAFMIAAMLADMGMHPFDRRREILGKAGVFGLRREAVSCPPASRRHRVSGQISSCM